MILRILRAIRALLEPRHLCRGCNGVFRESHMYRYEGEMLCANDFAIALMRHAGMRWLISERRQRDGELRWQ